MQFAYDIYTREDDSKSTARNVNCKHFATELPNTSGMHSGGWGFAPSETFVK